MSREDNSANFGIGLLIGVVGGIIAGVLCAPKSGAETRKDIEKVVNDVAEKYAPSVQEAKKEALNSIDIMRYRLEQEYNKISDSIKAKQMAKAQEKEHSDYDII